MNKIKNPVSKARSIKEIRRDYVEQFAETQSSQSGNALTSELILMGATASIGLVFAIFSLAAVNF